MLRRVVGLPYPLLLESAGEIAGDSRHCFLSADPAVIIVARGRQCKVTWADGSSSSRDADPLVLARELVLLHPCESVPGLPPFQGGIAGVIAYEYGQLLERIPDFAIDDLELPDVILAVYDVVISWDREQGRSWLISTGFPRSPEAPRDAGSCGRRATERLTGFQGLLTEPGNVGPSGWQPPPYSINSSISRESYGQSIASIKEYIRAGDIFQANFTQRFDVALSESPVEIYGRLRQVSPAPFAAYFAFDSAVVMSSSPERFLRAGSDQWVETSPIKGTRPRGSSPEDDHRLSTELASSEKDRAEHLMIVDVLRNDLSRVCEYDSVTVPELLSLRHYSSVHHLVSTIRGKLRSDRDVFDLLRATFPGGSITGAPKIRAMEIIAELEPVRRNVYCGTVCYVGHNGEMDSSIVIRTLIATSGRLYFSAGGGIVADSDADAEFSECMDKIRGILDALDFPDSP